MNQPCTGAERTHHRGTFQLGGCHAVADRHGVVLPDDLAKIARSGQVLMQASVGDQVWVAARKLAVDDPAHEKTGLAPSSRSARGLGSTSAASAPR